MVYTSFCPPATIRSAFFLAKAHVESIIVHAEGLRVDSLIRQVHLKKLGDDSIQSPAGRFWGITVFATSKQEKWANYLKTSTSWTKKQHQIPEMLVLESNSSQNQWWTLSEACIWASEVYYQTIHIRPLMSTEFGRQKCSASIKPKDRKIHNWTCQTPPSIPSMPPFLLPHAIAVVTGDFFDTVDHGGFL